MALLARGIHYFGPRGFPIAVRRVSSGAGAGPSHPHDYTEIEHYHDFSELVIVAGGRGSHVLEGERFPVAAGDVFVLQGSQIHCFREREDLRLINVMYDPSRLALPSRLLRRMPGYSALFMLEPAFRRAHRFSSRLRLNRRDLGHATALAAQLEDEAANHERGHEAMLLSILIHLMGFMSRRYGNSTDTEARALLRVGELISALDHNYSDPWTIGQMSALARLSRSTLVRTFRKATGKPPIDYLIDLRVEAAMRLLQQTDRRVTDIALDSGYSDSNYFARQFKSVAGCSPTVFRRRAALH